MRTLTFARKLSIVLAAALVAAHHALDVLSGLVALSTECDQRAAGLRAGRARRGALLGLLVQMVTATRAGWWVSPRRRHQRHGPGEPTEIMMVMSAAGLQRLQRQAMRRPALERRRCGRATDRASDGRHAGAAATAAGHRA